MRKLILLILFPVITFADTVEEGTIAATGPNTLRYTETRTRDPEVIERRFFLDELYNQRALMIAEREKIRLRIECLTAMIQEARDAGVRRTDE